MYHRINTAYGSRICKLEAILTYADIADASMSMTVDLDELPEDAQLVGTSLDVVDDFDDGDPGSATTKLDIGISGSGTIFLAGAADNLGTEGRTNGGTAGTRMPSFAGALTPRLTFTCSVNTNTLTKGEVKVRLFYVHTDKVTPGVERG